MFQIFMIIGWAVLLVILLYLWADVREISEIVKEVKREMLRNNIGGRAAAVYPNLREDPGRKMAKQDGEDKEQQPEERKEKILSLNESEEQVLREVLTEFLG